MGGCQNYGPFLGTLNIRCRIIIGIQKGTIILTTTHMKITHRILLLRLGFNVCCETACTSPQEGFRAYEARKGSSRDFFLLIFDAATASVSVFVWGRANSKS